MKEFIKHIIARFLLSRPNVQAQLNDIILQTLKKNGCEINTDNWNKPVSFRKKLRKKRHKKRK